MATDYAPAKMEAAIMFFCDRIRNGTLGRTKLAKLLYFLDFDYFEQHGESVTGAEYLRLGKGPYPKQMRRALLNLNGRVIEGERQAGPYLQYTYSLDEGTTQDLGVLSSAELMELIRVAEKWEKQTASELVAASHGEAPWVATADGEVIPYAYAYYRRKFDPVRDDEEESGMLELDTAA